MALRSQVQKMEIADTGRNGVGQIRRHSRTRANRKKSLTHARGASVPERVSRNLTRSSQNSTESIIREKMTRKLNSELG